MVVCKICLNYKGCPRSLAQLLIKIKKFILNEKIHYNPSIPLRQNACQHAGSLFILCKSWFLLSCQISWVTAEDSSLTSLKRMPGAVPWVLGIGHYLGKLGSGLCSGWWSTSQLYSWKTVVTAVAICGWVFLWRMFTRSYLWTRLLNFFVKEAYVHMLVHCMTIWNHICDNTPV